MMRRCQLFLSWGREVSRKNSEDDFPFDMGNHVHMTSAARTESFPLKTMSVCTRQEHAHAQC